ncbi:MAG: glycosyltransferase family 39 protein [Gemmatimonadota bacterium]|nr:MAG: glycosyltransferase family 39 protein [Gemmatimonadota bacterium]
MVSKKVLPYIVILFTLSVGIRAAYLADGNIEQRPLSGDARWYDLGALGFKTIVQNFSQVGLPLLKGELDEEKRAELGMNNDAKGFFRCPLVSFSFGVLFLIFGNSLLTIHIFHMLLSSLSMVLIYLIGRQVFSHRVGLFSALIAIFYTPLLHIDGTILSEPIAVFMVLAVVYIGLATFPSTDGKRYALFGASIFFLILARAAFKYSFIFFGVVGILFLWKSHTKNWKRLTGLFMAGFFLCLVLWMILTSLIVGTPLIGSYSRQGGDLLYRGSNLHVQGYHTDYPGAVHTRELREAFQVSSDYNEACSKAVKTFVKERFAESVILRIGVSSFLWREPAYRTPMRTSLITLPPMLHWHRLIVIMGLLGFFLSLFCRDWRNALLMAVPVVYSIGIYLTLGYEHRFNVPSMPFIIIFAVFQMSFFLGVLKRCSERFRKEGWALFKSRGLVRIVIPLIGLWILFFVLKTSVLFSLLSFSSIRFVFHCTTLLGLGALIVSGIALHELYRWRKIKGNILLASLLPIMLYSLSFVGWRLNDRNWHEWEALLDHGDERIVQEITLPSDLDLSKFEKSALKVDMLGGLGKEYDVVFKVNGTVVKRYAGGLTSDSVKFENNVHPELFQTAAENRNRNFSTDVYGEEDFRQWFTIPFDIHLIDPRQPLKIELHLEGAIGGKRNYLIVYGDYGTTQGDVFDGPSFARTPFETSRWKFWASLSQREKADNRLRKVTPLRSVRTVSSFYDGRRLRYDDLSTRRGLQSGQYRIRLELKHVGGYYASTDESGEQRVLWTVPREGDVPLPQDYLVGRMQRQADVYFSGYEIF